MASCSKICDLINKSSVILYISVNRRNFNALPRRPFGNGRNSIINNAGPALHKQPGPPYPGPNPRNPKLPLDKTIIHPSNYQPVYRRPSKLKDTINVMIEKQTQ